MGGFDLARVDQHPALIAHLTTLENALLKGLDIFEIDERAVDGDTTGCAGGHGGVEAAVSLFYGFGGQLHSHVFRVVHGAEDQRIDARACGRGGIGVNHPLGRFNQKLNGDAANLQASSALELFEFPVETLHIVRLTCLGQTDTGETFVDDRFEIVVRHQRFPVVDPRIDLGTTGAGKFQVFPNTFTRLHLFGGRDGILQIQRDDVCRKFRRLANHLLVVPRNIKY